jgi:protein SCO1/2
MPLLLQDGSQADLAARLRNVVTGVQLIFTRCSALCPLQGALFASVARGLRAPTARLLSISIDPENDSPAALREWMARFGSHDAWSAAAPREGDIEQLLAFLRGKAEGADRHTGKVYVFDRQARLVFRTIELPPPAQVIDVLMKV